MFAHRGASAVSPENTLVSFQTAREYGICYLEFDVRLTADGHPVVIHDSSVSRTTGRRGRVENMALSAISELDAGCQFTADHGRSYPFRGKGVKVPTLDQVLELYPDMNLTIEIKKTREEAPSVVAESIRRFDAADRVVVASHEHEILTAFRQLAPDVPTSFSKQEVREFIAKFRAGELAGYRPPSRAFQVPEYKGLRRVVSKAVIEAVHSFEVEVHVWTVNEPIHMERLLDWGVDGIMTDDPRRAIDEVERFTNTPTESSPGE